jgi:hypothetical protein
MPHQFYLTRLVTPAVDGTTLGELISCHLATWRISFHPSTLTDPRIPLLLQVIFRSLPTTRLSELVSQIYTSASSSRLQPHNEHANNVLRDNMIPNVPYARLLVVAPMKVTITSRSQKYHNKTTQTKADPIPTHRRYTARAHTRRRCRTTSARTRSRRPSSTAQQRTRWRRSSLISR